MNLNQDLSEKAAIPASSHQAITSGLASKMAQEHANRTNQSRQQVKDTNESSILSNTVKNVWQHPYVDVFKHFKLMPTQDWKQNKRQGDVQELFAKEIGRKVFAISGSISANNYIQIPHPNSMLKTLGLTGRYLYLQAKMPLSSSPFSFHIDLQMAERSHGIRISASNLYKQVSTQNGFVLQIPLNLDIDRWTVIVFDIVSLLKMSRLLPSSYIIEGSYQIKSLTICANSQVRGVYTTDNEYDFVTLPPDLRFKFSFDINRWPEYFAWLELPREIDGTASDAKLAMERARQLGAKAALKAQNQGKHLTSEQKQLMEKEVDALLTYQKIETGPRESNDKVVDKQARYDAMQAEMQAMFGSKSGHGGDELMSPNDHLGLTGDVKLDGAQKEGMNLGGLGNGGGSHQSIQPYQVGQYCGSEVKRSQKLNQDPIMELKFIIGYSPSKCLNLKWSKIANENVVLFTSCGSLIAMDVETNQQKRFFFGHSAPICCFDVAAHGGLIASAQEGKNSIIRIWDYATARCLQMLTMPVTSMQAVSFSPDGRLLASVGKDSHNKQMIIVWDISRIHRGEKPDIFAKQTSDFNILCLKFSPIDNWRLVSCGQQNIRFWRIKEARNIRGSAVVLKQHARDTVFTALDFEYGAYENAVNGIDAKSDALKRIYVASKHGMVYQISYHTEQLEATYQTNDSDIYSIAVNEAFCVTGSADQYIRVWALDFSDFFMEAKHEGTVCAVDISPDGLRVACGTLNGSLGVLNKANQKYKTVLRSHTDSILSMDFHLAKGNVITVSNDATIRLWNINGGSYDQVVEFSSPIDQPICVSCHPTLPIFSCGFKSGIMRVFDIEKTCVAKTFTQFDKVPLQALAYSPGGDLLVTCAQNGSVALHNANRQHLPTKMMHLEFAPQFVHVAFSPTIATKKYNVLNQNIRLHNQAPYEDDSEQSYQDVGIMESERESQEPREEVTVNESMFAIMGEYGNNLMIYSSDSIILKHQIQVGAIIRSFQFSKNAREVIVVTKDQRVRVYSLARFEGLYLRELTTVHRGACTTTDLSNNGGYMLTGGEDNLIKMWDYDAQKTVPFFYQAFIGHTYPLVKTMFNPLDNGMVVTAAENDGIYIWSFYGDTKSNYHPQIEDDGDAVTGVIDRQELHQPTVLEKMRMAVKEKKKPKLAEYSFIVSEWKPQDIQQHELLSLGSYAAEQVDLTGLKNAYLSKAEGLELNYNHFISMADILQISVKLDKTVSILGGSSEKVANAEIVNGYDGFGGVHDNLLWNPKSGMMIYTMNNKVIMEQTKTRQQTILCESTVRLSCLAQTFDGKFIAAAEGEPTERGQANIYVYDVLTQREIKVLNFFEKGIQSMAYAQNGKVLIAVGICQEGSLALFNVEEGIVFKSTLIRSHAINQVIVDPNQDDGIEFITIGSKGSFRWWKCDVDEVAGQLDLTFQDVKMKEELKESDFVTAAFTDIMALQQTSYVLLGTARGELAAFNPKDDTWVENGNIVKCLDGQIGHIRVRNGHVIIADSAGQISRYPIQGGRVFPPADMDLIKNLYANQPVTSNSQSQSKVAITSLVMDELNLEGVAGTSEGNIHYINFQEKMMVKLVSRVSNVMEPVEFIEFDSQNQQVFLTNCGPTKGDVKLYTSTTVDQIMNFPAYSLGPVKFVLTTALKARSRVRIIGHTQGYLKFIDIQNLKVVGIYKVALDEGEELTCGAFNNTGHNFAVGTSHGSVFLGYHKKDSLNRHLTLMSRVTTVSKTTENAVTSVELSQFTPIGSLLVSFDNGQVRLWQSSIKHEQFMKLMEMRGMNRVQRGKRQQAIQWEIQELGPVQFDLIDKFDMFDNPHGEDKTEEELAPMRRLWDEKRHHCEAKFAIGSSSVDYYFCYVSDLQYIFIRNYSQKNTVKIALTDFPTSLCLLDYYKLANVGDLEIKGGGLQAMACVGTKEGRVLCYQVENQDYNLKVKTKGGYVYGSVTGLAVQDNGFTIVVGSSSGELVTFKLLEYLMQMQAQTAPGQQ